eukprot:1178805-Prorocentrum_minimum.AAC.4
MLVSDVCQARATHGVQDGCWYFELTIEHLGETGHARCGWCTSKADIQAPVGADQYGFAYRDMEGTKVHKGMREAYGDEYAEGDVIGFYIYLPAVDKPKTSETDKPELVSLFLSCLPFHSGSRVIA